MATLAEILSDPTAEWTRQSPADDLTLRALADSCDFPLPVEYLSFLRCSNGGEGPMCLEPWWFQIWPAEEVLQFNRGYCVDKFLPGYFGIGSSGGGEMFVIRKPAGSPCPIHMVPFCPMAECDVVEICYDMEMFAMALGRKDSAA